MRVLAALAAAALLVTAGSAVAGTPEAPAGARPTVVLVHGAFAESASWAGVITRLRERGYPVIAAANPLRGLAGDAEHVSRVIRSVKGPVVLAGHSYGGSVITNAARGNPNVKGLVFVAAFAPEQGESGADIAKRFPGGTFDEVVEKMPLGDGSNDLYIRQDRFWDHFAADVPAAEARVMAATQRPVRDVALAEKSGAPAWKTVPSWFLLAGADQSITIAAQRFMAGRAGARAVVEITGGSHAVGVSHPGAVVDLVVKAARG
ncbi:alpha/beta hydrolase [Allokutzneria sp. A3M-2-11 16]|uniref:alpha/beta fold hydrolase n=1 Tax=Allokutzneria sp. A3M-2-11 16 TaxID=2962043 RepID=UPI0020B8631F|nr:alpha/beta hydrolase [Allokutzneria sp. A3M-2-11 16]MCP3805261.1 alpha/beta hydrolase [Allokutzneria sp. A3M-2-11 16]